MTLNLDLAHGQNYESGGQEFESLRARQLYDPYQTAVGRDAGVPSGRRQPVSVLCRSSAGVLGHARAATKSFTG
jgi:hypothetical protein